LHDFIELLHLAATLDGPGADTEERSDLVIGALHDTELLKFGEIDFRFRTRHSSLLLFEQAQFPVPVRKRQAQPLQIGIAREDFHLDGRDLATASRYSCCDSQ